MLLSSTCLVPMLPYAARMACAIRHDACTVSLHLTSPQAGSKPRVRRSGLLESLGTVIRTRLLPVVRGEW